MRLADSRWLTDENIHPDVVAHLRGRGLDVLDVRERGWQGRGDDGLLEEAYREGRVVLTHEVEREQAIECVDCHLGPYVTRPNPDYAYNRAAPEQRQCPEAPIDLSPPFLIVVQGGLVRLHTWG